MKIKIFILFIFLMLSFSCTKKEEPKIVSENNDLKSYTQEYIKNNPDFEGFYTRGDGKISEIRYENDKLIFIEYYFDGLKYIENKKHDLYFTYDHENKIYLAYNPWGRGNVRFNIAGIRYKNIDEAISKNNKYNFSKDLIIKSITSTSVLIEEGKPISNYAVENLIDCTHKSWVEGEEGSGIGTKITFEFERPYYFQNYTNYACIYIQNGFGNLKYFHENNRVKEMNIWINDSGTPVKVRLYDFHVPQCIVLRKYLGDRLVNKITFEILSVYPGTKYDDTCISEILIGPFEKSFWDLNYPMDPYLAELTYAYYRDIEQESSLNVRINKGILEVENLGGKHDYRPGWWPINVIPTSYHQIEFDFYKNTPIYIKPNNIINQEMREKNYEEDPSGRYYCLPFYKDFNLYSYKDGKWQIDNNEEIISEIKNLLNLHKDEYFTFQRNNSWSRLYSGINDNEDINYSYFDDNKYIQFTFYKKPVVLFSDDKSNEEYVQTYRFVFNGTKYVLSD